MTADITKTVAPKTDQLNADDLFAGKTMDVKITGVKETGSKEQPISISYEGDKGKPWKPSLGMRRVLLEVWGQEAGEKADTYYRGRTVRLFRDPDVKFGKDTVGGIRISHATDIDGDKKIALTVAKGRRVEFVVKPLKLLQSAPPKTNQESNPPQNQEKEQPKPKTEKPQGEIETLAAEVKEYLKAAVDPDDLYIRWGDKEADLEKIKSANPGYHEILDKLYNALREDLKEK